MSDGREGLLAKLTAAEFASEPTQHPKNSAIAFGRCSLARQIYAALRGAIRDCGGH